MRTTVDYASPREARQGLNAYFLFYNEVRPHQALGDRMTAGTSLAPTVP